MAYLLAGWDFARVGTHELRVTDDGGTFTLTYSTGTYAHRSLSSVMGGSEYASFPAKLQTDLNAGTSGVGTYAVSFATATGKYTITYSQSPVELHFTGFPTEFRMANLLGFTEDTEPSGSPFVSDLTAYYHLALARDGVSDYTRDYEETGQTQRAVSVNATAYSIGPTTYEKRTRFKLRFNALERVFADEAEAAVPWTYEHLVQHVRAHQPVLLSYGSPAVEELVFKLVDAEFSQEARKPVWNDFHAKWDLSVHAQPLGRL